jgi:large subunit ribosomal protein L30e
MSDAEDVRTAVKEGKAIFGSERTLKLLRQGKITKVFVSLNVSKEVDGDISHYTRISKVPIVKLKVTNEDLGTLCKKPFPISVIGVI